MSSSTNIFRFSSGYRPFASSWWKHYLSPHTYYQPFIYAYQRCTRGWADCDVWSIDNWLSEIIPATVDKLRLNDTGYPDGITSEEWHQILIDIANGFRAARLASKIPDGFYRELETSTGIMARWGYKDREYDWDAIKVYQDGQQAKFEHGAKLFIKYYHSLWD